MHELTVLVLLALYGEQVVLDTDTEVAFFVDSRLIGYNHAFFELVMLILGRNDVPAESCWRLVDTSKISETMSGSALEVFVHIPDWLSCQYIQRPSVVTIEEVCHTQVLHCSVYSCVIFLQFRCDMSQYCCSGNISRTFIISATCIAQKHTAFF